MSRIFAAILVIASVGLMGCASEPYLLPESDALSIAPGEAYSADSMMFRKPMPDRRDWRPYEFYFKHCSTNGNEAFYSKTSYDCTGPY